MMSWRTGVTALRRTITLQYMIPKTRTDSVAIRRSLVSYNGHLRHGHTWKLRKKIYGDFVLVRDAGNSGEPFAGPDRQYSEGSDTKEETPQ